MELTPSVVYRGKPGGRITAEDYDEAIQNLHEGKSQLEPDGDNCHVCGDGSHQAWECRHNPLAMARKAALMEHQWRCFHCGDVFTDAQFAAEHFGNRGDEAPAACGAMLNAFAEEFERYGVHRNFHNAASVRLLVVDIARRCAEIASKLEDDDCTAGAVWEAIRAQFGLSASERGTADFTVPYKSEDSKRLDWLESHVENLSRISRPLNDTLTLEYVSEISGCVAEEETTEGIRVAIDRAIEGDSLRIPVCSTTSKSEERTNE